MMNHNNIYPMVICAFMVALTGCPDNNNQNLDNPLVGLWEAVDPFSGTPDAGFGGTWLFEKNGNYQLEISEVTIAGLTNGYSSGAYELISDSILVLDIMDYENFSVGNWDTLHVVITDTLFVSRFVISVNPFQLGGYPISWKK